MARNPSKSKSNLREEEVFVLEVLALQKKVATTLVELDELEKRRKLWDSGGWQALQVLERRSVPSSTSASENSKLGFNFLSTTPTKSSASSEHTNAPSGSALSFGSQPSSIASSSSGHSISSEAESEQKKSVKHSVSISPFLRLFRGLASAFAVSQASQGAPIDLANIRSSSLSRSEEEGFSLLDSQQGDQHKLYLDVFNGNQGMGYSSNPTAEISLQGSNSQQSISRLSSDFSNGVNQDYYGGFFLMDVEKNENRLERQRDDAEETIDTAVANIIAQDSGIAPIVKTHGELAKLFFFNGGSTTQLLVKEFQISEPVISQFFSQNLNVWGKATDLRGNVDVVALASGLKGLSGFDQRLYTENNLVRLENMVTQSAEVARKQNNIFNRIGGVMKAFQLVQFQQGQASQSQAMSSFLDNPIIKKNTSSLQSLIDGATRFAESVQRDGTLEDQGGSDFFTTIWDKLPEQAKQQLVKSVGNEEDWASLRSNFESLQNQRSVQVDSQRAPGSEESKLTEENVKRHNELNTSRSSRDVSWGSLSQATIVPASHSTTYTQSAKSLSSSNASVQTEKDDLDSLSSDYDGGDELSDHGRKNSDDSVISAVSSNSNVPQNPQGKNSASIGSESKVWKKRDNCEEEWMEPGKITFTYHYTDTEGYIKDHSSRNQKFCHDLSGGGDSRRSSANTIDEDLISTSSESSQQSLKYHTVSVAWGADVGPREAGILCMQEYLSVMGLQRGEQANPTNTLAVIALLEQEWGSNDHVSFSNDDMSYRLAALFEKIQINAHPGQQHSFKEGAKEAFMHILQLGLKVDHTREKDPNSGFVGSRPSRKFSRLNSSELSLKKYQQTGRSSSKSTSPIDLNSSPSHDAGPQRENRNPSP